MINKLLAYLKSLSQDEIPLSELPLEFQDEDLLTVAQADGFVGIITVTHCEPGKPKQRIDRIVLSEKGNVELSRRALAQQQCDSALSDLVTHSNSPSSGGYVRRSENGEFEDSAMEYRLTPCERDTLLALHWWLDETRPFMFLDSDEQHPKPDVAPTCIPAGLLKILLCPDWDDEVDRALDVLQKFGLTAATPPKNRHLAACGLVGHWPMGKGEIITCCHSLYDEEIFKLHRGISSNGRARFPFSFDRDEDWFQLTAEGLNQARRLLKIIDDTRILLRRIDESDEPIALSEVECERLRVLMDIENTEVMIRRQLQEEQSYHWLLFGGGRRKVLMFLETAGEPDTRSEIGANAASGSVTSAATKMPNGTSNLDNPNEKGYVENPADPSSYIPARIIRTKHTPKGMVIDDKALGLIVEDFTTNKIRWTRPKTKNGKPHSKRRSVHIVDWMKYVEKSDCVDTEGFPCLTNEEIEAEKKAIRSRSELGK